MTQWRQLAERTIQRETLRRPARSGGAALLQVRGFLLDHVGHTGPLRNIYAATVQKAGSQWSKALFDHELVRAATGMSIFPQFEYDRGDFRSKFPAGCFVPGLYLSYLAYRRIEKPPPYRTFYIARDPRDIVVSWYFSVCTTHRLMGQVGDLRRTLQSLSMHDGLLFSIAALRRSLLGMATWMGVEEEEVAFFRLEDIGRQPEREVQRLLTHCGIQLPPHQFARVLGDVSRESLRAADVARRGSEVSHYRIRQTGHREHFAPEHYAAFRAATGDLVERLGYL